MDSQLFLLKRGGEEIYVGPLGHHSCHLITYLEVKLMSMYMRHLIFQYFQLAANIFESCSFKAINGVGKIKDGYNPATWMLEVTSPAQEAAIGVDFAQVYKNSTLYRYGKNLISPNENFGFLTSTLQSTTCNFDTCWTHVQTHITIYRIVLDLDSHFSHLKTTCLCLYI